MFFLRRIFGQRPSLAVAMTALRSNINTEGVIQAQHLEAFEYDYGRILHFRVWKDQNAILLLARRKRRFPEHLRGRRVVDIDLEYIRPELLATMPRLAEVFM